MAPAGPALLGASTRDSSDLLATMNADKRSIRLRILLFLLAAVSVFGLVGWPRVRQALTARMVLRAEVPSLDALQAALDGAADPAAFLDRVWQTGKVPHREWVMSRLGEDVATATSLNPPQVAILQAGALDADLGVREQALSVLAAKHSAEFFPLAAAQLGDVDPEIRLLGLRLIRQCEARQALPVVVPLLDDPDLRVVASAETALRGWTGIDYGVRMFHVLAPGDGKSAADPARVATVRKAVAQRQAWWREHHAEYPATLPNPATSMPGRAVSDFALEDLNGRTVRLSEFRGRPVLLNFWATWCTACAAELPDLIRLAKSQPGDLVIVGISLDGVPDEHGHAAGHSASAEEADDHSTAADDLGETSKLELTTRARVKRFVQARGLNYLVLLDPHNQVGARFNGGELPTNVLLDGEGRLRRRFIGGRSTAVLEAMVAELSSNAGSGAQQTTHPR